MTNLRAALTLTFENQATSGLTRLKEEIEAIKRVGREARLVGLENVDRTLRDAASGASTLARVLANVTGAAERATAAIHRTGQAVRQWGSHTFGAASPIGAFAAAAGAYSLKLPIESASAYSSLLRSGSIASGQYGADGDQFMKQWGDYYKTLALQTGQGSHALADVGFWMFFNGLSRDQIQTTLPGMARLATTYKADVKDVARVSEGLMFNLKVKPNDVERALGIMALLGKEGGFQFSDQAIHMPKVAAVGSLVGMSGMGAVEELAAAMQILLKGGSDREPGMAAVQLQDFLAKMDMEDTRKKFKELGVDIRKVLGNAAMEGRSPLIAGLATIQFIQRKEAARQKITDPIARAVSDGNVIKDLFGDKEARAGADLLLKNVGELVRLIGLAKGVDVSALQRDFAERARDDGLALDTLKENVTQVGDRIGSALAPAVRTANTAFRELRTGVADVDAKYPGLIDDTILATGSMLALGGLLGAIGLAAPVVAAGFGLIGAGLGLLRSPLGIALGVLAGGAYYVMSNWETIGPLFRDVWEGTKRVFMGVANWLNATLRLDHMAARDALIEVWAGGAQLLAGAIGFWTKAFTDLFALLDGWTGGAITDTFNAIAAAIGAVEQKINAVIEAFSRLPDQLFSGNGASRATPNTPPEYVPPGGVPSMPGGGNILELPFSRMSFPLGTGTNGITTIYIRAEPGTVVTRTEGGQNGIQINPGPTTVRI